jgi:phosphoribosylglycinamide formyltransferase-1
MMGTMLKKVGIGVLVSGSGSNLQSIIDHVETGALDADIRVVLSNNPDAYALERCSKHKIPSVVIDHRHYNSRESFDRKMIATLESSGVELVVMAGFMRILSPEFFRAFPGRVINIHPALLPAFPGMHVQQKAVEYGVRFAGCTVHFADDGVDTGPIIIQAVVPVYEDDTPETLSARILKEEHRIYPQAIQYYAEGRIVIEGRRVFIRNSHRLEEKALHNPPLNGF